MVRVRRKYALEYVTGHSGFFDATHRFNWRHGGNSPRTRVCVQHNRIVGGINAQSHDQAFVPG